MEYIASHSDDDPLTIEVKNRLNFLQENRQPDIVPPPAPPVPSPETDLLYEDFVVKFRRLTALKNYSDAFLLALTTLRSSTKNKDDVRKVALGILDTNVMDIWPYSTFWGYGELRLDYDYEIDVDWLIDRAIELNFSKIKKVKDVLIGEDILIIGTYPGLCRHGYYIKKKAGKYCLRYYKQRMTQKRDYENMLKAIGKQLLEEAIKCSGR